MAKRTASQHRDIPRDSGNVEAYIGVLSLFWHFNFLPARNELSMAHISTIKFSEVLRGINNTISETPEFKIGY